MKKVLRWRYYCEFCKKAGCQAGAMIRHETSCTMNPNRVCRMCQHNGSGDVAATLPELRKIVVSANSLNQEEKLNELREAAAGCAACMIAATRQTNLNICEEGGPASSYLSFDFKEEIARFWSDNPRHQYEGMRY